MKALFFFCQILATGALSHHSLSLTQEQAEQHLANLRQDKQHVQRAYMCQIGAFI